MPDPRRPDDRPDRRAGATGALAAQKQRAAEAAALLVEPGMVVGLGTGSTVAFLLPALARRELGNRCVATSPATAAAAGELGLDVGPFEGIDHLDIAIDGADQVDPQGWLVKGGGGAQTREKIVAAAARRFVVIVSSNKLIDALTPPVPLELMEFGLAATLSRLGDVAPRGVPVSPDGGVICDYHGVVEDPARLAARLAATPGVVSHGLFAPGMVSDIIVGCEDGTEHRVPQDGEGPVSAAVRTLTVLGCDGGYPGPGGAGSGYLVRAGGTTVLLDAGPGTFADLQRLDDPRTVDAVVLTHEHPDHWSDLESLAVWAGYDPGRSRPDGPALAPVPVYAPPGLRARSYFPEAPFFDWHEVTPESELELGALRARFSRTEHGPVTLAVRLDHGGAALAYSADTGPGWSVSELGPGIDLFLCEATYTAEREGALHHLSGRQAGTMAREAGVRRLVITHRSPTASADAVGAEARRAFGGEVAQASVGDVVEF